MMADIHQSTINKRQLKAEPVQKSTAKCRMALGFIVLLALGIRLYLVTGSPSWYPYTVDETTGHYIMRGMRLSGDPGPAYDAIARSFLAGQGLVNAPGASWSKRAPLYPLVLAGFYSLFDEPLVPIGILHAVLGALTVLMVWVVTHRAYGETPAFVAAVVAALLPEFLKYTPRSYASTLVVFLSALLLVAAFAAYRRRGMRWVILVGGVAGLIALCRWELIVLLPIVPVWLLLDRKHSWRPRVVRAVACGVISIVVVSPWLMHNRVTTTEKLAQAGGGSLRWLWGNNNPYAKTCWEDPPWGPRGPGRGLGWVERNAATERIKKELATDDPAAIDRHLGELAVQFIRSHPGRVAELMSSRFLMLWNIWPTPPPPIWVFSAFWCFLGVALLGGVASWRKPETRLLVLIIIFVSLFYSFIHGHPRYRLPAMPGVVILFAVGADYLWRRIREQGKSRKAAVETIDSA